ncbi:glycosyltransferase family 2 protein [Biomaibacter acetigenes]|uniref:glycosyltransferase family 2 protein n=1 Tax=Biomaibacter acetigenes TaxID=2316383 RepID=UPI001CA3E190|nr:glycosyltransferase family 2 protein [Biomaibacter acetigenes]
MVLISIVIVNWNSGRQLYECLKSIYNAKKDGLEIDRVVVVDNASSDNSLFGLEEIDIPLKIIKNSTNRGFAAACNQGAKESNADYLLFLNPDTLLFKYSLSKPIAFMEKAENRNIGIVGIQLINENKEISRTCARFPTLGQFNSKIFGLDRLFPKLSYFMAEWDHKSDRFVDHVIGAFFLVRRQLFEKLNGFDERFFVYLEDLDFSYRAKQLGYSSYYLTSTKAYHKGGGSSEKLKMYDYFIHCEAGFYMDINILIGFQQLFLLFVP